MSVDDKMQVDGDQPKQAEVADVEDGSSRDIKANVSWD